MSATTVNFSNGKQVPILGLGTWNSLPGEVTKAVEDAFDIGYRHIDCALIYGNEHEVGAAIKNKIGEGKIKREDVFVTSKLWNTLHRPALVETACRDALRRLDLEYLDLFLIHWPFGFQEGDNLFPLNEQNEFLGSDVPYEDTWKAMEILVEKGLVKSIGLSNFNKRQIEDILKIAKIHPVNLQIECHPYLNQKKLIEFCKSKNITITAYSPLGSPERPWAKPGDPQLLDDNKLKVIAKKYNKSVAQLLLHYQIQRGVIVIPKSVNKIRIQENFNIFDFVLTDEDMNLIDTFDCNGRLCPVPEAYKHPLHPFINDQF